MYRDNLYFSYTYKSFNIKRSFYYKTWLWNVNKIEDKNYYETSETRNSSFTIIKDCWENTTRCRERNITTGTPTTTQWTLSKWREDRLRLTWTKENLMLLYFPIVEPSWRSGTTFARKCGGCELHILSIDTYNIRCITYYKIKINS